MNSSDQESTEDPRAKRIEELLYIIGGCEVVLRNNQPGRFGAVPQLATIVKKVQQKYIAKFERAVNGLEED